MKWNSILLGELESQGDINLQTGPFGTQLKASDYTEHGTPVINVRNIGFGNLREEKLEYVPENVVDKLEKHLLQEGDIVFGRKGAVDRHLLVKEGQSSWMQGSDCIRLRVQSKKITSNFLSYWFLLESHKNWMLTQCSNKATMASLNQEVIKRIPVSLPNIDVQNKIADILSRYDEAIANNRRRIELLERSARLLYKEWFVHLRFPGHEHVAIAPDGIPEGWKKKKLEDVCLCITDGSHTSPKSVDDGYPMASVKDMHNWGLDIKNCRRISEDDYIKLVKNNCKPLRNDILIAKDGSYLKHSFVVDKETELVILSSIAILRPNIKVIYPHYLSMYLQDPRIKMQMTGYVSGSALPRIILKEFRKFEILYPSFKLQQLFKDYVEPIMKNCYLLIEHNQKLQEARDLLLPRLMNGEITV